jgi:nucleotide-binding universal stress UspA family protein
MEQSQADGGLYRHIACCVDDSDVAPHVVQEAQRLRAVGGGRLTLLHVVAPPMLYGAPYAPADGTLADVAREWFDRFTEGVDASDRVLLEGYPPREAVEWAKRSAVDLMVAGAHRGIIDRFFLGSFAAYLAYHAPCPVLLVRPLESER